MALEVVRLKNDDDDPYSPRSRHGNASANETEMEQQCCTTLHTHPRRIIEESLFGRVKHF